eukprot:gnl/TRDRNA2_/TRDRNA2_38301_c0_seq1.p1 gnl/TRDRNA2_/TRDRNA2_38301_c0~~gnl/TRDRNA2_/TRDRNA2_38301_c0_seq1.p1  ORF type:complete len:528 (-),score=101.14 gnl/TRDRNA2_/TRDRNA2_38301_c0_seq1:129-1712(-)
MFQTLVFGVATAILVSASRLRTVTHKYADQSMKERMPWYKSGDELHQALQETASGCSGAEVVMSQSSKLGAQGQGEVALDVLRVRRSAKKPKTKAMLVFGEHAREVLTGESALELVRNLCGTGSNSDKASKVLDNVEFVIVPNANPIARKEVEKGYFCKRTNEDNVDLNRNWGSDHRDNDQTVEQQRQDRDEQYPGPDGFSEPETEILRDLAVEENPDVFVSVHTGAYLLGAPYGYTPDKEPRDRDEMEEVLKPISEKYCGGQCPYGGLSELINYENHGCDIDYIYEHLKTPYVYTWEIFVGEDLRQTYIEEANEQRKGENGGGAMSLAQQTSNAKSLRSRLSSDLEAHVQDPLRGEPGEDPEGCIKQFNPTSGEEAREVANNWCGAYLDLAAAVAQKRHPPAPGSTGVNATSAAAPKAAAAGQARKNMYLASLGDSVYSDSFSDASTMATAGDFTRSDAKKDFSAASSANDVASLGEAVSSVSDSSAQSTGDFTTSDETKDSSDASSAYEGWTQRMENMFQNTTSA